MDDKKAKRIVTLVFLVMPLAFFLFSGGFFLLNRSTYNSIQENHTIVEATVSKVTKSKGSDTLVVDYTVDGKDYKTVITAESGKLKEGETLELLCSTKAPAAATTEENYKIMERYFLYSEIVLEQEKLQILLYFVIRYLLLILNMFMEMTPKIK